MKKYLIHCITNIVTVNDCANILLAAGGSPTMAHHPLEVAEIASAAGALVLNMGAMESCDAMRTAGKAARAAGVPIVLDPVGAAGASYRRTQTLALIDAVHPACIRGNYSEIKALATNTCRITGVDAADGEELGDELLMAYAAKTGAVIAASGATDIVADAHQVIRLTGGSPLMSLVTGTGCMSTALMGLWLARAPKGSDPTPAIIDCVSFINHCAETAEAKTRQLEGGTMTFRQQLIDQVWRITEERK